VHVLAVTSVDAPGHGGRPEDPEVARLTAEFRRHAAAGEPYMDELARASARRAEFAVPEWRAALEALRAEEGGSVGYYGVSLGTAIGIPFLAAEPRVAAAVLGLAGNARWPGRLGASPSPVRSWCDGTAS
jgi:hypothetical protein